MQTLLQVFMMLVRPKLRQRIAEFLETYRLGIDFGEAAGGIALVHRNDILDAETFIDFHETTLEQRRTLRRGRRTRSSKKMRLARLRSWVLRQKVDGKQLPDPYRIMREHVYKPGNKDYSLKFQTKPGMYRQKGKDPVSSPTWIAAAKAGAVDAEGFVCALTHLFQKRGYKWDDRGLHEMSDAEIKEFLMSSRIPNDELQSQVSAEIESRAEHPDDPSRGRTKVSPEELRSLLAEARKREPQPRKAEHRSIKEQDLREVVAGFGNAAKLPRETIKRWQKELAQIFNKRLRQARFENRLKTGCAWCGKATPRKVKVRDIAYRAAVHNLRAREGFRLRPLSPDELNDFWTWWDDREKSPGVDKIKRHLKKLGAQDKMARQLHNLLKGKAEGRASLCRQCLGMAQLGKTMKDAGVDWQTISTRKAPNPCREQHDGRVLQRVEQMLFVKGKRGEKAWRHGPVAFITLEVPRIVTTDLKKGQMAERATMGLRERLCKETGEKCIYCEAAITPQGMQIDHIFPESRGGPDLRDVNLVAACSACNDSKTGKRNQTPHEWFGADAVQWAGFCKRVESLPLPLRKKELLLSESDEFPDNPTPLAHVGSRPRQFVVGLRTLFARYGIGEPTIFLKIGHPHVQRVEGDRTARLRRSWLFKADEKSPNFPPKNRTNLANHAQDAALLAACPPHTWRDHIFCYGAHRPSNHPGKKGQMVWMSGLALQELAPDWAAFEQNRQKPLLRVLGRERLSWKRSFSKETFWQEPEDLDAGKLKKHKQLTALTPDAAKAVISEQYRDRFLKLAGELGLKNKQVATEDKLKSAFGSTRRITVTSQPGGPVVQIKPKDGPLRKVWVQPGSEAVLIWQSPKGKVGLSVVPNPTITEFAKRKFSPPVPSGARTLGRWSRNQLVKLPASAKHPAGFYRVTKIQENQVTLLHETSLPTEIAERIKLPKDERQSLEPRTLGKTELAKLFAQP